jgi:hypothetical protein
VKNLELLKKMQENKNFNGQVIFKVVKLGATNTKGARYSITNIETRKRFELPLDYKFNYAADQVETYFLNERPELNCIFDFWDKNELYLIFEICENL